MKAIAAWAIERGAEIVMLEQLLGSRAIGSTLVTQLRLKSFNLNGLLLILLWMLSPFGGQASLRIPSLRSSPSISPIPVAYVDYDSRYNMYTPGSWWSSYIESVRAIYSTALIDPESIKQSPRDSWGNLKIPVLEALGDYDPTNTSRWLPVSSASNPTYSSLIGLPLGSLATGTNLTFSIDTHYMSLRCDDLNFRGGNRTMNVPAGMVKVANEQFFQIATPNNRTSGVNTGTPAVARPVVFEAQSYRNNNSSIVHTQCDLTSSYVELNVSCIDKLCATTAIRASQQPHNSTLWSPLDYSGIVSNDFFADFVNATVSRHEYLSTATEYYFTHPDNPYAPQSDWPDFSTISAATFATRFAQLLNTYYMANIAPSAITGRFSTTPLPGFMPEYSTLTTPGQMARPRIVFVCHKGWLAVLFVASGAMLLCGIASAILGLIRQGPDILDSFSSWTRDNPFVLDRVPHGGSNLDGMDRAAYLKRIKVRLGDSAMDEQVGHIAIGTVDPQRIARLRKGRLYD